MIQHIFLDLDDTIFDFKKAERIALSRTLREEGIKPTEHILNRYSEINLSQWKLLELGKLTREEVLVRRYEILFQEVGMSCDAKKISEKYEDFLGEGHYFIPGAKELLEDLSKKYHLYLASNGAVKVQMSRIKSAGIEKYLEKIFLSEQIGYEKPSPQFFEKCFAQIPNFKKEEALILGDSLTSDIRGGKNAGILTVWFHPSGKKVEEEIVPDYEIGKLEELKTILSFYS